MIASSPLRREPLSQRAQQVRKIDRNLTNRNPTSRRDNRNHTPYSGYDNNSAAFSGNPTTLGTKRSSRSPWNETGRVDKNKFNGHKEDSDSEEDIMSALQKIQIPKASNRSTRSNLLNNDRSRSRNSRNSRKQFSKKAHPT